ncbi:hypothetical protein [Streptomyces flavalbus]|uniref:Extensin n=1 Tax=Streptomyces flavalbus TaxID=2665155 RepID=A0ABW2WCI8_9ACTN
MADEQYRWLDRDTAERLLRGEPLDAADADARDGARRLSEALRTLATPTPLTSEELPGEEAALAAFRKVRAERAEQRAALGASASAPRLPDAGLVRIEGRRTASRRPRWGRPLRFGLAATLTVGMVGGVAVAAGTGVLPTPFDDGAPAPASSVSAAVTPERPLVSPSPDGTRGGGTGTAAPGAGASASASASGASREPAGKGDADGRTGDDRGARPGGGWPSASAAVTAACRDLRDGKSLDAGRRRALEGAAGGPSRVPKFCDHALKAESPDLPDTPATDDNGGDNAGDNRGDDNADQEKSDADHGKGKGNGKNDGTDEGGEKDKGKDEDKGKGHHGG